MGPVGEGRGGRPSRALAHPRRPRAVALVVALVASLLTVALGSGPAVSSTTFTDDFESGTLAAWTVGTGGTGTAVAEPVAGATGSHAAHLAASGSTSYATLRRTFGAAQDALSVSLRTEVIAEGPAGSNVPLLRMFSTTGTRLLSVYRQNQASDKVYVQHSGTYAQTSGLLPLGAWKQLDVTVVVNGASSTLEVRLDGAVILSTATANIAAPVSTVQVGNDTKGQPFELAVDDVAMVGGTTEPTPPDTTIDSGPSGTVASTSASFTFSSTAAGSTFTCRLDAGSWVPCTSPHSVTGLADGGHTFAVAAKAPGGLADPTPAERTWTVGLGSACDPSQPAPTTSDPGTVVVADGFEDGLGDWSTVLQEYGGTVTTGSPARTGRCAAVIDVPSTEPDARANLRKGLPDDTDEIWATGWFNTLEQGASSDWNTPTFRIISGGKRIFDLSRQNQRGSLFVRWPAAQAGKWTIASTNRLMQMNRWYHVKIHLVARDLLSTVQVWLDGTLIYENHQVGLGVTELETVQVGAEHQNQFGKVAADDVVVTAEQADVRPPLLKDGFEQGLKAWDKVSATGTATVTTQTGTVTEGAYAARVAVPDTSSYAYLQTDFQSSESDVTAMLDFRVTTDLPSTQYLSLMALQDAGGTALASLRRRGGTGALQVRVGDVSTNLPVSVPVGTWARIRMRMITTADGTGLVVVNLNGVEVFRQEAAPTGVVGPKSVRLGTGSRIGAYTWLVDDVLVQAGTQGYRPSTEPKLLIADHNSRRLVIMDYYGRILWQWDNPTGRPDPSSGPLGVRWMPGNRILATFGTGEVGLLDVATKTWVWKTSGYNGDWFQSPYDAELLPDGNLAVAMRFNSGGRVSVYDRSTGTEVWRHLQSNTHSVHFRTAAQSENSALPTLLIGGWGAVKEVTYQPGSTPQVSWQIRTEYTHDALVLPDNRVLTAEGYYIQKVERSGLQLWRRPTPDEAKRIAINTEPQGGYIYSMAELDRVEFRDDDGHLVHYFSQLSDGTMLDYPYGIQVIDYPG